MSTALLSLDSFADSLQEFSKSSQKNTCKKLFAKYLSADGCFVRQ